MNRHRQGLLFGSAAYVLWGVLPLYWPLLEPSGTAEILAHRIVWSLVVVAAILSARRSWSWARSITRRQLLLLTVAAAAVAVNWGVYIYAVNSGQVVETSLGYFITPLVTVLLGVAVLKETLRPAQWTAVALAGVAVAVLTADYGRLPWIALALAASFASYGLLKKTAGVAAVPSLTVETAALLLPAGAFLGLAWAQDASSFGAYGVLHATLLAGAGVVTALPLLCFGAAAIRVPLTTLGLLQYLAPVLQFVIGVLVYREAMPASRWAGFALVWSALVLLSADGLLWARRRQRAEAVGALPAEAPA